MATSIDNEIARYQEWYKSRYGRTIDRYTARAHLKKMTGNTQPSRSPKGSMQTHVSQNGGMMPNVMWNSSSIPRAMAAVSRGKTATPYLDFRKSEA